MGAVVAILTHLFYNLFIIFLPHNILGVTDTEKKGPLGRFFGGGVYNGLAERESFSLSL